MSLGILLCAGLVFATPVVTPDVVPAKANEPAQKIGPLPAAPDTAKSNATASPDPLAATPPDPARSGTPPQPDPFAATPPDPAPEPESMVGTLFRTFLVLGVIVGLIYITLNFGLRKMMGVRGVSLGKASLVKVVERIPLDPKRTLFVIEAAGEYLLVGGADTNLNLIAKLPPEEVARVIAERKVATARPHPFLQRLLSRPSPTAAPAVADATAQSPAKAASGGGRTEES